MKAISTLASCVLILVGCAGDDDLVPITDLVKRLPAATLWSETTQLDLGTPAARPHLVSGWSYNEKTAQGETFVWATGEESEIRFVVVWLRDLPLVLRSKPHRRHGLISGKLTLQVNGHPIEITEPRGGGRDHHLTLPAGVLFEGENGSDGAEEESGSSADSV
jgi:hypothetical protein